MGITEVEKAGCSKLCDLKRIPTSSYIVRQL